MMVVREAGLQAAIFLYCIVMHSDITNGQLS